MSFVENEKKEKRQKMQPVRLMKNVSYPTYQLFASVDNQKTPVNDAFKIAVCETFSWLRKRFRAFDEIPHEMIFPEPEDYLSVKDEDIKSFRINEGYVVDVVYVKEKGIWAFHLIEPDLGPEPGNPDQKRSPVPGRVFETNIAYRIFNGRLECGFKTICSEPMGTNCLCEVFRTSVVKTMVRNPSLGLTQLLPVKEEPHMLDTKEKIRNAAAIIKDKDRQIPLVIIAEYAGTADLADFCKSLQAETGELRLSLINKLETIAKETPAAAAPALPFKTDELVKYCMGYAHFCILPFGMIDGFNEKTGSAHSIVNGGVRVIYPVKFSEPAVLYLYDEICPDKDGFRKKLGEHLADYPKHKEISFGNVKFLKDARMEEQQIIIDMSTSKADIIKAFDKKIEAINAKLLEQKSGLSGELQARNDKIGRLNDQIKEAEDEKKKLRNELEQCKLQDAERSECLKRELSSRKMLTERPLKPDETARWVEKFFSGKLMLHNDAVNLLKKVQAFEVDMPLLCDALEYLANEYRDCLLRTISSEEKDIRCSEKYGRPFSVAPSGGKSAETYPKEYKIKYGDSFRGKAVEQPLDLHLRVGVDTEHLLRIYFLYDSKNKLIVVGSLPKHLSTISEG